MEITVQLTMVGLSRKTEMSAKDNRKRMIAKGLVLQYMKGSNLLKTYCKNINVLDIDLITHATYQCLDDKYTRNDTLRLLSEVSGLTPNQCFNMIYRWGKQSVYWIVDALILQMQNELKEKELHFIPIWYKEKVDASSFKIRKIGIQNIKQQIYDYIAVAAMQPIFCRIGQHQYASIKDRGCIKGVRTIRRWMRNKEIKYYAKLDVKKCYESIDKKLLMKFLKEKIKNDSLIWLIETLINTFEDGLSIGSYLSQFLCNLYMSQLYHEIEHMHRIRKSRRNKCDEYISLVTHQLFYMDDILLLGTNAKDIHKAVKQVISYAKNQMGLTIKLNWIVSKLDYIDAERCKKFIDMMGYRIYRDHVTIRRRVFKRIRRALMKVYKLIKIHKNIHLLWARRCISYYGQIKNSDSVNVRKKYRVDYILKICKKVVSDESKIYNRAVTC